MPRFHFNIHDGCSSIDREGQEFSDWKAARFEAIRRAGLILNNDAQRIAVGEEWRMEVTDESGLILFQLDFVVLESPVIKAACERHMLD